MRMSARPATGETIPFVTPPCALAGNEFLNATDVIETVAFQVAM